MSLLSAQALLLDVQDLQEADRILTFLTSEHGKKRGVARAARRKHSRFAGQLQPLAKARVTWFEKEGRELVRVSGVELLRPPTALHGDLEGILLGSYLVEHLLEFAQENEPSELLFRLADSTLEALLSGVDRDLAARYFEAWILRLTGIYPVPRECPLCGRSFQGVAVLPSGGETLVCRECSGAPGVGHGASLTVGAEDLDFLVRIGRESLPAVARRPPGPEVLRRIREVNARVRRSFLQRELRSYRVIERTLAEG